jgi:hypothetical protein
VARYGRKKLLSISPCAKPATSNATPARCAVGRRFQHQPEDRQTRQAETQPEIEEEVMWVARVPLGPALDSHVASPILTEELVQPDTGHRVIPQHLDRRSPDRGPGIERVARLCQVAGRENGRQTGYGQPGKEPPSSTNHFPKHDQAARRQRDRRAARKRRHCRQQNYQSYYPSPTISPPAKWDDEQRTEPDCAFEIERQVVRMCEGANRASDAANVDGRPLDCQLR